MQRISVITPSYNQGRYLDATIRSVLDQEYDNLEYMVFDGGSTDESVDIIKKYEDRIAYWESKPDRGQAHAINKGLERASGGIIGWLNSDDVLLPGSLRRIAEAHRASNIHVTCGMRIVIDEHGNVLGNRALVYPTKHTLERVCTVWQESVYWDRRVLDQVGYLDESLSFAMDYDYWQRILAAGFEFTPLPYFLGAYRMHDATKNVTMQLVRCQELRQIYRDYLGLDVSESDVKQELGRLWEVRRQALQVAASVGLLRWARIAEWLTMATRMSGR